MTRRKNDQIGFCDCLNCENRGQVSFEKGSNRLYYNCEGECGCVRLGGQRFQDHIITTFVPLNPGDDPREVLGLSPLDSANDDVFDVEPDAPETEPEPINHTSEPDESEQVEPDHTKQRSAGAGWFGEL